MPVLLLALVLVLVAILVIGLIAILVLILILVLAIHHRSSKFVLAALPRPYCNQFFSFYPSL